VPRRDCIHPALSRHLPALQGKLPWLSLGCWPTPISRMKRIAQRCGADLWIKQDDLSGAAYGGNKVRKLEPLLARALDRGCNEIITVGGIGSNHVIATAVLARDLGLKTRAVVIPQPVTAEVRHNLDLALSLGVTLLPCRHKIRAPFLLQRALLQNRRAFGIGPGGSSPLGTLGFVAAALELREQIGQGLLPEPEDILVALGSGGTMAGLALGCAMAGLRSRVVGVRVVERPLSNSLLVRALISRTRRLLASMVSLPRRGRLAMEVVHQHFGQAYGRPTAAGDQAMKLARQEEGLLLEPTYTAKVMAALLDHCQGPGRGRKILFWNTHNSRDTAPLRGTAPLPPLPDPIPRWLGAM